MRIGSLAGRPFSAASSSACGPVATKLRPWKPRVSHATNDSGLPDRSGCTGCSIPGLVLAFCGWNTVRAPPMKPRTSTPLTSVMTSTTTMAVPTNIATSSLISQRRIMRRANSLMASLMTRAAPTSSPPTTSATPRVRR